MGLIEEIIKPLTLYILITFLATEVIKQIGRALGLQMKRTAILISLVIGIGLSYGWTLSVLPAPNRSGFEWFSILLTGLIIAGAASGLFSWIKEILPQFDEPKSR